jgi:hypothetical protein
MRRLMVVNEDPPRTPADQLRPAMARVEVARADECGSRLVPRAKTSYSPRPRTPRTANGPGRPVARALTESRTAASTEAVTTAATSALPL